MGVPVTSTAGIVAGTVASAVLFLWPLVTWLEVRKLEKPKYSTLKALGTKKRAFYDQAPAVEIRKYDPQLVAEVSLDEEEMRAALSSGFRQVAGFIFGKNKPAAGNGASETVAMTSPVVLEEREDNKRIHKGGGEKIAMTSPVATDMREEGGRYTVAFIMPTKYTKATLPKPENANVQIKEVPAQTLAAISWRGGPRPTDDLVATKRKELEAVLQEAGVHVNPSAKTKLYQYYPPFAPRWVRLQDVLLPVDYKEAPIVTPADKKVH
ncbi:hypothetical protein WJX81_003525 [Elliptochloris bilobata]|uniref:SOUL heme-binding protein n=1 Tax=Elliptochloris bilobata TaxID=381761 RepID=A0AAW1SLH1_9CHLO